MQPNIGIFITESKIPKKKRMPLVSNLPRAEGT
jgi:hypothetical protein